MKFKSKPTVIEAEQWHGPESSPMTGVFCVGNTDDWSNYYVVTIHGERAGLSPGDWVIQEPDGVHHYPCRPDIFAARYEPL